MIPSPDEKPLMTVDEFLELMGDAWPLGRSATYVALKRGELPSVTIGRTPYLITAGMWSLLGLVPPSGEVPLTSSAEGPVRLALAPDRRRRSS